MSLYSVPLINGGTELVARGGVSDIMEYQEVLYVPPSVFLVLVYFGNVGIQFSS